MDTAEKQKDRSREEYKRTWKEFETMDFNQQATFWVEATAAVLGRGVEKAGRHIADELEDLFRESRSASEPSSRPGPAEPETSQQQSPRGGRPSSNN